MRTAHSFSSEARQVLSRRSLLGAAALGVACAQIEQAARDRTVDTQALEQLQTAALGTARALAGFMARA